MSMDDAALLTAGGAGGDGGGSGAVDGGGSGAAPPVSTGGGAGGAEQTTQQTQHEEIDLSVEDAPLETTQQAKPTEEPELSEFTKMVSARLREMVKKAPELQQVLNKYPEVNGQIEAVFRREAALREVFPTIAEARQFRETFPNGIADVHQMLADRQEMEQTDNLFYGHQNGQYAGHETLLKNFSEDDPNAMKALLKNVPKFWYRFDPDTYHETMSKVVGATMARHEIPQQLTELYEMAKEAGLAPMMKAVEKLYNIAAGYTTERKETQEDARLKSQREENERLRSSNEQEKEQQWRKTFQTSNMGIEKEALNRHPAIQRLMKVTSLNDAKKQEIVEKCRREIEGVLKSSVAFKAKLRVAYDQRNVDETSKIVRAAWAMPWLVNRVIRRVLQTEIPSLVAANKGKPAAAAPPARRTDTGATTAKGAKRIGNRWYRDGGNGSPYTVEEVLRGEHLNPAA